MLDPNRWLERMREDPPCHLSQECDADPEPDGSDLHDECRDRHCQCGCHRMTCQVPPAPPLEEEEDDIAY